MFSKACKHGIRAVLIIATKSLHGERIGIKKIAAGIEAPEAFTAKILQNLARQGVVQSAKGPNGGFYIEQGDIENTKLMKIVKTIDGDKLLTGCGLGLKRCDASQPCPIHHEVAEIRSKMEKMLNTTSIYQLSTGINDGLSFLKR